MVAALATIKTSKTTEAIENRAGCDKNVDLIFSCPPYADLEVCSEDPRDLSVMEHHEFLAAYRDIIRLACARLADNRFACFVIGDVRDPKGFYRNLPGVTVAAFEAAGLRLYNECILVTAVGSLPIRVRRQFASAASSVRPIRTFL